MTSFRKGIPTLSEGRAIAATYRRLFRADTERRLRRLASQDPDGELLDLVSDPFESVADVSARLAKIERRFRERNDRRSVFLTVYAMMTSAVGAQIEAGFFHDPEWVREYLVTFAEYYRRALSAFERREFETVPSPWRVGFAASVRGVTLVAQDALLGINAHINYDLSYTLHDVKIDPNRDAKRADHDRINEVLERLTDTAQEAMVSVYSAAGVAEVDGLLGPIDERLALVGLERSRQFAWDNAALLADLPWPPVQRYVDWRVRTVSTGAAYFLLGPRLDAATRERLRRVEQNVRLVAAFHDEFTRLIPSDPTVR